MGSDDGFFYADFNGSGARGKLNGQSLDPATAQGLRFVPIDHSKALKVEAGTSICDDFGGTYSHETGTENQTFSAPFGLILVFPGQGGACPSGCLLAPLPQEGGAKKNWSGKLRLARELPGTLPGNGKRLIPG